MRGPGRRLRGMRPAGGVSFASEAGSTPATMMKPFGQYPDGKAFPKAVSALGEQVEADGGRVLAVYQEPVGDHWQIFCLLPMKQVEPTPYQRDLSPTHAKRLTDVVKKIDRFVDPIVAVSPRPGFFLSSNGHH